MAPAQTNTTGRKEKKHAGTNNATAEEQCHPKKIFVGGLAHKCTTQHLREHFLRFGTILDAVVLRWPDGRSRGFGYVTFADVASASLALKEPHSVGGRQVEVKRAVPGTNKLFVGGLPQNTPASELREHFEKFGVVSDAVVMIDAATNRSRGFGFVCFLPGQEGAEAVAAALANYDHHFIRNKWIEVKSASPPHKLVGKDKSGSADCVSTTATDDSSSETQESPMTFPPAGGKTAEKMRRTQKRDSLGEPQKISLSGSADSSSSASSAASEWLKAGSAGLDQPQQSQSQQASAQQQPPYPFGSGVFANEMQQAQAAHHWYTTIYAATLAAAAASAGKYDAGFAGGYPPAPYPAAAAAPISLPPGLDGGLDMGMGSDSASATLQDFSATTLSIDGLLRHSAAMQAAGVPPPQRRPQVQI